jgi:hypothetical protein
MEQTEIKEKKEIYVTNQNSKVGFRVKKSDKFMYGHQDFNQRGLPYGTITSIISDEGHNIRVKWDNGSENSYRGNSKISDLYLLEGKESETSQKKYLDDKKKFYEDKESELNNLKTKFDLNFDPSNSKERLLKYKLNDLSFYSLLVSCLEGFTIKCILSERSIKVSENKLLTNSNILPKCCGITEFGDFVINEENKEKINIFLDIIKLRCHTNPKIYGAYSIINYFVNTEFTKILEKRDDLTFIKEFKNPKTGATLKTFIFDNNIDANDGKYF